MGQKFRDFNVDSSVRLGGFPKPLAYDTKHEKLDAVMDYLSKGSLTRKDKIGGDRLAIATAERKRKALADTLEKGLHTGKLDFTIIWGGFKESETGFADGYDEAVMKRLSNVKKDLENISGVDVNIRILFCNVHATINGVPKDNVLTYYNGGETKDGISKMAAKNGLDVKPLNELYLESSWGGRENDFESIFSHAAEKGDEDFKKFLEMARDPQTSSMRRSVNAAQKHSRHVGVSKETAAATYHAVRTFERGMVDKFYPDTVYVSFSDPESNSVLPQKSLNWWAVKARDGHTPWMQSEEN